jgi:beta-lactamase class A
MITRRRLLAGAPAALLACAVVPPVRAATPAKTLERTFAAIEAKVGGRLGVAVYDNGSGLKAAWRGDERFPLCSTFKWLAGAAVLARVDAGDVTLGHPVAIRAEHIVTYSPTTEKHVGETMPLGQICEAAITLSDNTAGNLMLAALGGPEGFNCYVRSLGDDVTRLDRIEPALNEAAPDDPRDTTTPLAMIADLDAVLVGDVLSRASRNKLTAWLIGNETGDARLRAGLPETWRVGDKTGTCNARTANDVGIAWPPSGKLVLIAVYLAESDASPDAQTTAIADVARAVAKATGSSVSP